MSAKLVSSHHDTPGSHYDASLVAPWWDAPRARKVQKQNACFLLFSSQFSLSIYFFLVLDFFLLIFQIMALLLVIILSNSSKFSHKNCVIMTFINSLMNHIKDLWLLYLSSANSWLRWILFYFKCCHHQN